VLQGRVSLKDLLGEDGEAKSLGGFEIDHQLELGRRTVKSPGFSPVVPVLYLRPIPPKQPLNHGVRIMAPVEDHGDDQALAFGLSCDDQDSHL
jgi:hypothetical protein